MAEDITVKNVQLWSLHGANRKGLLAEVLEPLAAAGANLRVVMGYRHPGEHERATVEVFPVEGAAAEAAARKAGFAPSETACLLVEGTDRKGLGAQISRALSDAGISMAFLMEETVGRKFSAVGLQAARTPLTLQRRCQDCRCRGESAGHQATK